MARFKWALRFVRRPMFMDPVPVLYDRDMAREQDGRINETRISGSAAADPASHPPATLPLRRP